jgi:hypothetical protein
MRIRGLVPIMILLILTSVPAAAAPDIRENLDYQVSLGPWEDVARVHLTLKKLAPERYLAEFSGAARGMWSLLSRWLPERYQTEMIYRDGRLQPLVYREEFMNQGTHVLREYRFDYDLGLLTLWRQAGGREKVKKWEVPLQGPVYDLLSLFYNVRLGALGPLPGGANLRVAMLPTPEPQEMVFRIGSDTDQGRKVMLDYRHPGCSDEHYYFIILGPDGAPTLAWTRVNFFGKLTGRLLNPGEIRKAEQLVPPPAATPVAEARP